MKKYILLPADSYVVINKTILHDEDRKIITSLYLPAIGMHTGNLYIFCNKYHNKLKCLYYDGTGFWLLYKRLESGTFKWIKSADGKSVMITEQQLKWLLEGLKMEQKSAFKECRKDYL